MNIQILGLSAQEVRERKFLGYCLSKMEISKLVNSNVVDPDPSDPYLCFWASRIRIRIRHYLYGSGSSIKGKNCLSKMEISKLVNSNVVEPGSVRSVPMFLVLQDPDTDPSLFVRIRVLPLSSKKGKKTLFSTVL